MINGIQYGFPTNFFFSSQIKKNEDKNSPFKDLNDLKDLAKILTEKNCNLDQWIVWKSEIKAFISTHSDHLQEVNEFFDTLTKWGLERNPEKMMTLLVEIVSLDLLIEVVRFKQKDSEEPFEDIFDLATKKTSRCPEPVDTSIQAQFISEWKKCRPVVFYFIPNLLNIFLGAFNFLDTHKKYTTLWDKHLLLEILYKFFIIPYCLVKVLEPIFVVPAKVYLVATLIIVTTGILISCYQRWFRPIPDEIVNCTNLDKQMEMGLIHPKIDQPTDIDRLIASLEVETSVLLIGLSGEGKTALVHRFLQLKQQGQLPKKLQQLNVFENDCGLMMSNVSFGHSELINQIKDQIVGYEDRILLFFDEFDQIAAHKGAFQAFKKRFLEDQPRVKFVAAITEEEWKKLKELDQDRSFRRRIACMKIKPSTDDRIREMIKDFRNRFAQDVPVTQDAVEAMIQISANTDYLPKIGRAAKALEIFKRAVGLCRAAYHHHYAAIHLTKEQLEVNQKQIQKIKKILAHRQKMQSNYYRLTHLISQTVAKKGDQAHFKDFDSYCDLKEIDILDVDENEKEEREKNIQSSISKECVKEKDQILYIWYYFYARHTMKNILNREMEKVDSRIAVQVDKKLIEQVCKEIKEMDMNE